jgi:hypothetical protein
MQLANELGTKKNPANELEPISLSSFYEHLQEFAKIHLANIVIWQLDKIYGK